MNGINDHCDDDDTRPMPCPCCKKGSVERHGDFTEDFCDTCNTCYSQLGCTMCGNTIDRPKIHAAFADAVRYRVALEAVKKHQELVCNGNHEMSATWRIATKALEGTDNG